MSKKQLVSSALIFIIGFACGLILITLLSSASYKSYLAGLQIQFRADQGIKAIRATRTGDIIKALVCRQNVVDTFDPESYEFFYEKEAIFNFWSVVQLYILEEIKDSTYSPQGERLSEGLARGKLAFVLDNLNMKLKAEEEWARAVELAGYSSKQDAFKKLISKMIETEVSTFE